MNKTINCIHCEKSFEKDWMDEVFHIPIALLVHQEKCGRHGL